jgi:succinate dehydrogenase / fumarate reductase flavoprotein subunit
MSRTKEGLTQAIQDIGSLREEFWTNVKVPGSGAELNAELEKAGRVADFLEFGEVMCNDALAREESCGGHFREEFKTEEGEARRDDENFCHAAVWEYAGYGNTPNRHKEEMEFEYVKLATRSYK